MTVLERRFICLGDLHQPGDHGIGEDHRCRLKESPQRCERLMIAKHLPDLKLGRIVTDIIALVLDDHFAVGNLPDPRVGVGGDEADVRTDLLSGPAMSATVFVLPDPKRRQ